MSAASPFPGVHARLHRAPDPRRAGGAWLVIVAADPADTTPDALARRGRLSALLTQDRGVTFPDAQGIALARAMLGAGGVVVLAFADAGDALVAMRRVGARADA